MRFFSLITLIALVFSCFVGVGLTFAGTEDCSATDGGSLSTFLRGCASGTNGVAIDDLDTGINGTKEMIVRIATRVISYGALFAVAALVYSGIQYTLSYGDDEKIKKAKMTGIYSAIGLLLLLLAFPLVDILVNFIFSLTSL